MPAMFEIYKNKKGEFGFRLKAAPIAVIVDESAGKEAIKKPAAKAKAVVAGEKKPRGRPKAK